MEPKISLAKDLENINSRLESLVADALKYPVTSQHFKQIRRLLNSFERSLKTTESLTKKDTANEIFELNYNWKSIYFRNDLNKHSILYSDLDLNERKLFKAIIVDYRLGDNPNFFDIMFVIRKIVIADEIKLAKVGPLVAKSLPTLIKKLQQFCNLDLELRKNRT